MVHSGVVKEALRAVGLACALLGALTSASSAEIRYELLPAPGPLSDGDTFSMDLVVHGDPGDQIAGLGISVRWDVDGASHLQLESFRQEPFAMFGDTLLEPVSAPVDWADSGHGEPGQVSTFNQLSSQRWPLEQPATATLGRLTWRWIGGPSSTEIEVGEFNTDLDRTVAGIGLFSIEEIGLGRQVVQGGPPSPCELSTTATYDGSAVQLGLSLQSSESSYFGAWGIEDGGLRPIWLRHLPPIGSRVDLPLSIPFDEAETFSILVGLFTLESEAWCFDYHEVDTLAQAP